MIIRKGKKEDLNQILSLLRKTPQLQGAAEKTDSTYNKDYVLDYLTDKKMNLVLVVEENNKIIGFILAEMWYKKRFSFIADIVVKENYRKKNIGSALFDSFESYCKHKKIDSIICLVQTKNKDMQKFCNKKNLKKGHSLYYYQKDI